MTRFTMEPTNYVEASWKDYYCLEKQRNEYRKRFCFSDNYMSHGNNCYKWGSKIVIIGDNDFYGLWHGEIVTVVKPDFKIGQQIRDGYIIHNIRDKLDLSFLQGGAPFAFVINEKGERKIIKPSMVFCRLEDWPELEYKLDHPGTNISYQDYLKKQEYERKIRNGEISKAQLFWNVFWNALIPCCKKSKDVLFIVIILCLATSIFRGAIGLWIVLFGLYVCTNIECFIEQQKLNGGD